jgi:hypothetical protein
MTTRDYRDRMAGETGWQERQDGGRDRMAGVEGWSNFE